MQKEDSMLSLSLAGIETGRRVQQAHKMCEASS